MALFKSKPAPVVRQSGTRTQYPTGPAAQQAKIQAAAARKRAAQASVIAEQPELPLTNYENKFLSKTMPTFIMLMALIGFTGLAYSAYKQKHETRAPGEVVTIKADPRPFKVKPESPGGMEILNKDKVVYNTMVGRKEQTDPAHVNTLPLPEEPVDRSRIAEVPAPFLNMDAVKQQRTLDADVEERMENELRVTTYRNGATPEENAPKDAPTVTMPEAAAKAEPTAEEAKAQTPVTEAAQTEVAPAEAAKAAEPKAADAPVEAKIEEAPPEETPVAETAEEKPLEAVPAEAEKKETVVAPSGAAKGALVEQAVTALNTKPQSLETTSGESGAPAAEEKVISLATEKVVTPVAKAAPETIELAQAARATPRSMAEPAPLIEPLDTKMEAKSASTSDIRKQVAKELAEGKTAINTGGARETYGVIEGNEMKKVVAEQPTAAGDMLINVPLEKPVSILPQETVPLAAPKTPSSPKAPAEPKAPASASTVQTKNVTVDEMLTRLEKASKEMPASMRNEEAQKVASKPAGTSTASRAASEKTGGTYKVQLGSYKSREMLEDGWSNLKRKFPGEFANVSHEVHEIDLGTRGTFYRLIAGPMNSELAALTMCKKMSEVNQGCFVVKP